MRLNIIYGLFFISSLLLIFITVDQNAYRLHSEKMEKLRLSRLQLVSQKTYKRTRKSYVPMRSCALANQEIEKLLLKSPISFERHGSEFFGKSTLIKIVKIINHVKERVALTILAHTDTQGSAKENLILSQQRADRLKHYFEARTHLPLIVAIGYGELFALKDRVVEINLKRIKE